MRVNPGWDRRPMAYETLLYEVKDRIARITINRPDKRNALNATVIAELVAAFRAADADANVGAIVLTGAGEKAFCAGADLGGGGMIGAQTVYERHEAGRNFLDLFRTMRSIGKPIVCAANGHVLAGGLGLALACDALIAVDDADFGTPEINVGLFPYVIMATIVRSSTNRKRVLELLLTGDKIRGAEVERLGWANRVVPRAELAAAVDELAKKLASKSPAILRLGRRAWYAMGDMTFEQAIEYLQACLTVNTLTEDAAEGIGAFLEKREAKWKGR
ncbi:MAG TPA: enoyl-CoA hydratase-related protein [Actinomycetota bacterium]|nr:enoyl-CoA hydratase-related protein [Actinomycetota bacterium]